MAFTGPTRKAIHWPTINGQWSSALTYFAKCQSPRTALPEGVYLRSDEQTLAIFDGFPKAQFHFLILPSALSKRENTLLTHLIAIKARIPFPLHKGPTNASATTPKLALAGGKLALGSTSKGGTVPASHLQSLNELLASPYAEQVLASLRRQSESVVELIKEEMRSSPWPPKQRQSAGSADTCGTDWGVRVGFHAVPRMDTVHLHVISSDLVSDRLKNKKHYLSFHPTHGFWLDLSFVERLVEEGRKSLPHSPSFYEQLLKAPLTSFRDGKEYGNIPKLKQHLEDEWIEEVKGMRLRVDSRRKRSIEGTTEGDEEGSVKAARKG